jgi:hypothetical protein
VAAIIDVDGVTPIWWTALLESRCEPGSWSFHQHRGQGAAEFVGLLARFGIDCAD